MTNEPIFVVGVQRSGTTLLAAMLAAHTRLSCGPETHFFRFLSQTDHRRLSDPVAWPEPALHFITSIDATSFQSERRRTLLDRYEIEQDRLRNRLRNQEPSIAAVLSSVTDTYCQDKGKQRWVEKTPDHLLHVRSIREFFPTAPIIRLVRDPRDVALALRNVPWGVHSFAEGVFYWERMDRASRDFFATDSLSLTVRFEDLIQSPVETLTTICGFINEDFERVMLDTSETGRQINSRKVSWKEKVREPLDTSRVRVWRTQLSREENLLAEAIVGDRIDAYGYDLTEAFERPAKIWPAFDDAARYSAPLAKLAATGLRFWTTEPGEPVHATVYLGDPGRKAAIGRGKTLRLIRAATLFAKVARSTASSDALYWVPEPDDKRWRGLISFLLKKCLSPHRLESRTSIQTAS